MRSISNLLANRVPQTKHQLHILHKNIHRKCIYGFVTILMPDGFSFINYYFYIAVKLFYDMFQHCLTLINKGTITHLGSCFNIKHLYAYEMKYRLLKTLLKTVFCLIG